MEESEVELPIEDILSYSRIDLYKQCQYRYKLKYIQKNYTETSSLALEIGVLLHYANELKFDITNTLSLDEIWQCVENGFPKEKLLGTIELIDKYGFDYYEECPKTGLNMEMKIESFKHKFYTDTIEDEWEVVGLEKDFLITFNNKAKIRGYIDRVDRHRTTGEYRVVDYKTNKKAYENKDLTTPLQMYIYSLACYDIYGEYPVDCIYDMLFLDIKQYAKIDGLLKRGEKALDKVLDSMIFTQELGKDWYKPKPTPLCNWCDYCKTNANAIEPENMLCDYHSLWTRQNKTFATNKKWIEPSVDVADDWGSWD